MVYQQAHAPASLSHSAATLLRQAVRDEAGDRAARFRNASALLEQIGEARDLVPVCAIPAGESGYLRLAVADRTRRLGRASALGIAAGYPRTLMEQAELRPQLHPGETEHAGAAELRRSLITLPTHRFVTAGDIRRIGELARASSASPAVQLACQEGVHA